ncbi:hypothetical protein PanWU01x14_236720, partial [Parasponia andersonii]
HNFHCLYQYSTASCSFNIQYSRIVTLSYQGFVTIFLTILILYIYIYVKTERQTLKYYKIQIVKLIINKLTKKKKINIKENKRRKMPGFPMYAAHIYIFLDR